MDYTDLNSLYEDLHKRKLAAPKCPEDVENILACIRTKNGYINEQESAELEVLPGSWRSKYISVTNGRRKTLAGATKMYGSDVALYLFLY